MKKYFLRTLFIILAVLLMMYIFQFRQSFVPMFENIIDNNKSIFQSYSAKVVKTGNEYNVQLKDVIGTTSEGSRSVYVRLDVTISAGSRKAAEEMGGKAGNTVAAVTEAISMTAPSILDTPEGKNILKRNIERTLTEAYGPEAAKDIYFENFVYQ
ncbi:MAG: flagellar basal body-associated FliL family protein [Geovibrio sp.]|jgi:flagellar basal body-associated protein FliL|uniref:flagellar basal body-associated FliL family protein n=1 Tax=Geovibrio ferrireducens TaxID=46201 RepID=UPI00224853CA|nr:flagellar basal body-associated FliL family protein [Geovibrio ferrireducens]MCD8492556.1 flagellar basal body-associated FliL family protein [Geovibrio sp.]